MKFEKGLGILMWVTVALLILISFATIMIGYSTNFEFFFSFQDVDVPELGKAVVRTSNVIL